MRLVGPLLLALLLLPVAQAGPHEREATLLITVDPTTPEAVTTVDGLVAIDGSGSAGSTFNRLQTAMLSRASTGTPYTVTLHGEARDGILTAQAEWTRNGQPAPASVEFTLVVVERTAARDFLIRATPAFESTTDEKGDITLNARIPLDPTWTHHDLGLVTFAASTDENRTRFRPGEVVQSATWLATQGRATVQERKAVLIEHATRDGCASCATTDDALALLASQYGFPAAGSDGSTSYAVPPTVRAFLGLAGGGALAFALTRRRA